MTSQVVPAPALGAHEVHCRFDSGAVGAQLSRMREGERGETQPHRQNRDRPLRQGKSGVLHGSCALVPVHLSPPIQAPHLRNRGLCRHARRDPTVHYCAESTGSDTLVVTSYVGAGSRPARPRAQGHSRCGLPTDQAARDVPSRASARHVALAVPAPSGCSPLVRRFGIGASGLGIRDWGLGPSVPRYRPAPIKRRPRSPHRTPLLRPGASPTSRARSCGRRRAGTPRPRSSRPGR